MELTGIEVLEDRTPGSRCDQGFLTLRRLLVRNRYADGSASEPYPCDVMQRPGSDAVVAVIYELSPTGVRVLLREASRVPVYLRREQSFVHPDPREYLTIHEVVAGLVEQSDPPGPAGLRRRAALEALEEAGLDIPEQDFEPIGGETFASPGVTDEKLFFCAAPSPLKQAGPMDQAGAGDGSVMEEWAKLEVLDVAEALRRCRSGEIPDMKTELALLRLCDHVGYLPQLGRFVSELPEELRERFQSLGVIPREERA